MIFGTTTFAEVAFSDEGVYTPILSVAPDILYVQDVFLTFPLRANQLANFGLKLNQAAEHSLNANTILNFTVER